MVRHPLYSTVILISGCCAAVSAGARDPDDLPVDKVIKSIIADSSASDLQALGSVNWRRATTYTELTNSIPSSFCKKIDKLSNVKANRVSGYAFGEIVIDRDWLCLGVAEQVTCIISKSCGDESFVPIAYHFDRLNQMYPYPPSPDCETQKYPAMLGSASSNRSDLAWFRRRVRWHTVCVVDNEEIRYIYDHSEGWHRESSTGR